MKSVDALKHYQYIHKCIKVEPYTSTSKLPEYVCPARQGNLQFHTAGMHQAPPFEEDVLVAQKNIGIAVSKFPKLHDINNIYIHIYVHIHIHIYTYKTTLRVIKRFRGGGGDL